MAEQQGQKERIVGEYRLVRKLGEGSFGSVYLAEHVRDHKQVALKLLKVRLMTEEALRAFLNEARTMRFHHPHIVPLLDFELSREKMPFLVMEYTPKGTLLDLHPKGSRVPLATVVSYATQIASALQYAHDRHVIHRDVKPENALLNAKNEVWLSDFGIATASLTVMPVDAGEAGQAVIVGTYPYMAPEQLVGRPTFASDQYSLAIMAYEWLCGKRPFEGQEYIQWCYLHGNVPPPPLRDAIPSLSPAVEEVVLKALAKKPEERFDRVELFARALKRAARGEDISLLSRSAIDPRPSLPLNPVQVSSNRFEQLFKEGVQARTNGNIEEAFRNWKQIISSPDVPKKYSVIARKQIRELCTEMLPLRRKQAYKASMQGHWQEEIRMWKDILILEPSDQDFRQLLKFPFILDANQPKKDNIKDIKERIQIARQNEQCSWMYTNAQQLVQNNDYAAARAQLEILWQNAPYYGDPAGLAQKIGCSAALNYEQAIAAEQKRLLQKQMEREKREKEIKEREKIEKQKRNDTIILTVMIIIVLTGAISSGIYAKVAYTAVDDRMWIIISGVMACSLISGLLAGIVSKWSYDEGLGISAVSLLSGIIVGMAEYYLTKGNIGYSIIDGILCGGGAYYCYSIPFWAIKWVIISSIKVIKWIREN